MGVHEIVPFKKQTLTGGRLNQWEGRLLPIKILKEQPPFIGAALIASIKQI